MAFLDDVKTYLRISTDALDAEVQDLIEAAKIDLILSGVDGDKVDTDDPLIRRAVVTYCKAHFGYDNPDHDRLLRAFNLLKSHLTISDEYRAGDEE